MITIEAVAAFSDNYIWLLFDPASRQAVVVDPGDAAPVQAALSERGLSLAGIMITHHHFDHVGGLAALKEAWSCTVWGPANPAIEGIDLPLSEGDRVEILGMPYRVLEVPGHTLDHIAYVHDGEPPLLFADTRVYCAHEYTLANLAFARAVEPDNAALASRVADAEAIRAQNQPTVPSTLALELATNPFLRAEQPELVAALADSGKLEGETGDEVFATVRAWKDNF